MSQPGPVAQLAGRVAYEFSQIQHLIPTYLHIIFAALFPIYTAAHASLSRPSSAAKPVKSSSGGTDEDDDEDSKPKMEGLSATDAILFPVMAGLALTALYYLLKWDKDLLNKIMNWYMSLAGLYGVIKFLSDGQHVLHAVCFPEYYTSNSKTWHVMQSERAVHKINGQGSTITKTNPLPGLLSLVPLPGIVESAAWQIRSIPQQKLTLHLKISGSTLMREHINLFHITSLIGGSLVVLYFAMVAKPWFLTNLMGFAFSYTALQLISPTTFGIGSLVLIGLFFYDIYMVFYTPMMVTVAKNLDIPIKLLFPRPADPLDSKATRQYSMLGLGDIVLPGIVMGLALRFDLYLFYLRKQQSGSNEVSGTKVVATAADTKTSVIKARYVPPIKNWASHLWTTTLMRVTSSKTTSIPTAGQFPKTYFHASLLGYIVGMIVTLSAMHWSSHPQPALLYLVPGVLITLWATALIRGEIGEMWAFSEQQDDESEQKDTSKQDRQNSSNASLKNKVELINATAPATNEKTLSNELKRDQPSTAKNTTTPDLLSFTIRRYKASHKQSQAVKDETTWVSTDQQAENGQPAGKRLRTS